MKIHFFLFAVVLSNTMFAQKKNVYNGLPSLVWPTLYDVSFVKAKDKLGDYDKPVFSAPAKALNGKTVILPGYMVPFENGIKGNHFMLSSLPLNACFFCGVGGPESVVEVSLKNTLTYTDKPIEIRGILKLNDTDPDKMMYELVQAEYVGEAGL